MVLEYKQWRRFKTAIERAIEACENSGNMISDHFAGAGKMVTVGSGVEREVEDFMLSRYARYLIVMNSDPHKDVIALGQTYFAVKTRQQELIDDYERLNEEQKRLAIRTEIHASSFSGWTKSKTDNRRTWRNHARRFTCSGKKHPAN